MGKNVLILGASGDIGSEIAIKLGNAGYQLILHMHQNAEKIKKIIHQTPDKSILSIIRADLKKDKGINSLLDQLMYPIDDIIFAQGNAYYGLFQDTPEEVMNDMLAVHVKAPWMICKSLVPQMIKNHDGNIVFISSVWGEVGASNEVIYSSVKGAQNSFVKALAKELGPSSISINAVNPGFIHTKMNHHLTAEEEKEIIADIPLQRVGLPIEVADTVVFLLDRKANYIQGQLIRIDGGWQ